MLNNFSQHITNPAFKVISEVISEKNLEAYVIGGYVRDLFLNRKSKDIDVVVVGNGLDLATLCAKKLNVNKVSLYKNFGTAHFTYKDFNIEFVGARKESYQNKSRKPIIENGTIKDDQNRRDFTINTLAINLNKKKFGELIDPFNGIKDIENKIIRTPLEPNKTYSDDPLRMMRAVRFASELNFTIKRESIESIKENSNRLSIISRERIIDELNKIILSKNPSKGFNLLFETKLLHQFFPEMVSLHGVETIMKKSHKDNFNHTLEVLENISKKSENIWLRWAAIMHDIGKPKTKRFNDKTGWTFHGHEEIGARMVPKIFKRLKLPMDRKMKYVQKLVRLHLRPIALVKSHVTDSAIRRLLSDAEDDIDDLMILCNADVTSKNEMKVKKYKENFKLVEKKLLIIEEKDRIRNFQPPIDGITIMKTFGLHPCQEIGTIKSKIKEAILDGKIKNNSKEAYDLMIKIGLEMGLKH